jgi:glycosyltransferase involved in cell wall biosynthesis
LLQSLCGVPEISAVRVEEPNGFCAAVPGVRAVTQTERFVDFRTARPGEEKVLILQRIVLDPAKEAGTVRRFLDQGYLLVAEMDDDPAYWPKHEAGRNFTFRCCHAIQTTTEPLAAVLREYNPNVAVFPNQLAALPPPRTYADGPPTLFFGAINREDDWRPLMPALNRVLGELGDRVRTRVVFDRPFFDALETPHKSFEPWCSYERYHAVLRACDVGFLPLADTRFNGMKSDLKFLQCAAHGVAALASPPAYGDSIADGETGLLFRGEAELADRLRALVGDADLRRRLAARAYEWVRGRRMLAQHFRPRYEWYAALRDRLPRLTAELLQRAPEVPR